MDISVFVHLRWNFVYQRPQHVMERMSKEYRVFYFEEPDDIQREEYRQYHEKIKIEQNGKGMYHHYFSQEGVHVIVPLLQKEDFHNAELLQDVLKRAFRELEIKESLLHKYH